MSAEGKLGPKKLRRAEHLVGEPLAMAFAWSPHRWEAVTPDDRHVVFDPRAEDPEWVTCPIHWTTCPSVLP